jgi:hypothetical protein
LHLFPIENARNPIVPGFFHNPPFLITPTNVDILGGDEGQHKRESTPKFQLKNLFPIFRLAFSVNRMLHSCAIFRFGEETTNAGAGGMFPHVRVSLRKGFGWSAAF